MMIGSIGTLTPMLTAPPMLVGLCPPTRIAAGPKVSMTWMPDVPPPPITMFGDTEPTVPAERFVIEAEAVL